MKKLLTLMLALGVAAPQLQAQKPQSYYDNIVANVKKQTREDALKTLGALPVADQRIIMAMVAEGLAKNPKDLDIFLPLALSVHANDRAWTRRGMVGSGALAGAIGWFSYNLAKNHFKDTPEGNTVIWALDGACALGGLICVGKLLSLIFRSTPVPLANYTLKAMLKKAQSQ